MDDTTGTRRIATAYVDALESRDWDRLGALLTTDVVYEIPQTRERVRGRAAFVRFNVEFPGDWHLRVDRVVADGRHAAILLESRVGGERQEACVWLAVGDQGLITRITDYWPAAYEPPAGREHLVERW